MLPVMKLMFFFLLVQFYNQMCLNQEPMIMASPVRNRAALHKEIASDL